MTHTATNTPDPHSEQTEAALAYLARVTRGPVPEMTPEVAVYVAKCIAAIAAFAAD